MKVCSVEGCGHTHYAYGWCRAHWSRVRYYSGLHPERPVRRMLSEEQTTFIRDMAERGCRGAAIARYLGVSESTVTGICHRDTHDDGQDPWQQDRDCEPWPSDMIPARCVDAIIREVPPVPPLAAVYDALVAKQGTVGIFERVDDTALAAD